MRESVSGTCTASNVKPCNITCAVSEPNNEVHRIKSLSP